MKKLLIFHPTIAPYRIDFFNDLYKAFDAKICLYYENLNDQKFQYNEIKKRFNFIPDYFGKSLNVFGRRIPIGYIRRLKEHQSDIVIVNEYSESCWISVLYRFISRKKFKIVSICDDSEDIVRNEGGLHAAARALAVKHLDGVILCNDGAEKIYRDKYPGLKTIVMPIIQDEERFFPDKAAIIKRAKEIIESEKLIGKRVFLYVGRISPEKNPLYLVESFVRQHEECPDNILYIIGNHIPENLKYNEEIDEFIKKSNASIYIRKIGRREGEELKAWFYAGQILVVPSTRESFGAVVNEALLCGDYVMLSSIAGSAYLIDDSNGELIDISSEVIDFSNIDKKINTINLEYIDNKSSGMKCEYSNYMDNLLSWINDNSI